ncbi:hypothetical protein A3Q56_00066 [Intoshia linei]|uniref:SH3 domain-containing protein n=1 Tax=Intoshia linei TaxID=1819745 RepID=A0A177BD38_9BILA|nr:hypothetical protein A3Q56_00066 [Intoshia linei]
MVEKVLVVAKFNYEAQLPCEINLEIGSKYKLIERNSLWWLIENEKKVQGLAPSNFLKESKKPLQFIKQIRNSLGKNKKLKYLKKENQLNNNENSEDYILVKSPKTESISKTKIGLKEKNLTVIKKCSVHSVEEKNTHKKLYKSNSMRSINYKCQIRNYCPSKISLGSMDSINEILDLDGISTKKKNKFTLFNPIMMHRRCSDNAITIKKRVDTDVNKKKDEGHQFDAKLEISTADGMAYVRYSYDSLMSDELSIKKGDILSILFKSKDGWWYGEKTNIIHDPNKPHSFYIHTAMKKDSMDNIVKKCHDIKQSGWFPSNYVLPLCQDDEETARIMLSSDFKTNVKKNRNKKTKSTTIRDENYKNTLYKNQKRNIKYAKAKVNHDTSENRGISLKIGDIVEVLKEQRGILMVRDQSDYVGYVPSCVMEFIESLRDTKNKNEISKNVKKVKMFNINQNPVPVNIDTNMTPLINDLANMHLTYTTESALKQSKSVDVNDNNSYLSLLDCYTNSDEKFMSPSVPLPKKSFSNNEDNIISETDETIKFDKIIEPDSLNIKSKCGDPIYDVPTVPQRKFVLIKEIEDSRCYYSKFNHEMSQVLLSQEKHASGVFLIRPSNNEGQYTLVVKGQEKLRNFRMQIVDNDKIQIGAKDFQSFYEMIKYYSFNPLFKNEVETIFLTGSA